MRLWLVNHYAVPRRGPGITRHAMLAEQLRRLGHDVTVFASAISHSDGRTSVPLGGRVFADEMDGGVRFRYVRSSPYRGTAQRLLNMLSFARNLQRAVAGLGRPDAVLGSSITLHAADAARRLARRFGAPFLLEIRDVWPEVLLDMGAASRLHPLYLWLRRLELRLYRSADRVVALLPGMAPYLESHGVPRDRIVHVPNGIERDLYPEPGPPPADGPFTVSFFGAHGAANGLDTVVDAARDLPDVRFRFVGEGPEKPALRRRADGLPNVAFLPAVPKRELAGLARDSHAFVFHLRPMKVLEKYGVSANKLYDYMLAGRPVIYACRSFNDPVAEAGAGLPVAPGDPAALATAVRALRALPAAEREAMGRRGRAWVLENHDMAVLGGRLESAIRSLTGRAPSGPS